MRVKVGDTWYDAATVPIMVELDPESRVRIVGMPGRNWKYAEFPEVSQLTEQDKKAWMQAGAQR